MATVRRRWPSSVFSRGPSSICPPSSPPPPSPAAPPWSESARLDLAAGGVLAWRRSRSSRHGSSCSTRPTLCRETRALPARSSVVPLWARLAFPSRGARPMAITTVFPRSSVVATATTTIRLAVLSRRTCPATESTRTVRALTCRCRIPSRRQCQRSREDLPFRRTSTLSSSPWTPFASTLASWAMTAQSRPTSTPSRRAPRSSIARIPWPPIPARALAPR